MPRGRESCQNCVGLPTSGHYETDSRAPALPDMQLRALDSGERVMSYIVDDLREEIETLKRENAQLRDENGPVHSGGVYKCERFQAQQRSEIERLREVLQWIRGLEHDSCDDSWYSCPLSPDGCIDPRPTACTCGKEEIDKRIDAALSPVTR